MGNPNEDSGTNAEGLAAARLAIDLGGKVNGANTAGETTLHGAVWRGSPEIIQLLVDHGVGLDVKNASGLTPLQLANGECYFGDAAGRKLKGSLCSNAFMLWRRPQVIPLLRELMTARGLKPEMRADLNKIFAAGAEVK